MPEHASLLTPQSAADYLGEMSVETLRLWRYRGTGPRYIKVGRHVRYRVTDLSAWLDTQTVTPGEVA